MTLCLRLAYFGCLEVCWNCMIPGAALSASQTLRQKAADLAIE